MEFKEMFLQRYGVLVDFYLEGNWDLVPPEKMRQRPHPRVNSIAWILWHMSRVEDAGLNRFVTDGTQVLDQGDWMKAMNLPYRHNGGERWMNSASGWTWMVCMPIPWRCRLPPGRSCRRSKRSIYLNH